MEVFIVLDVNDGKGDLMCLQAPESKNGKEENSKEEKNSNAVTLATLSESNLNQIWKLYGSTIYSVGADKNLDANGGEKEGAQMIVWYPNNEANQKFYFHLDGTIRSNGIQNRDDETVTTLCLTAERKNIVLSKYDPKSNNQKWRLVTPLHRIKKK